MNCPVCDNVTMHEMEKDEIQYGVCPSCRGIWLAREHVEALLAELREMDEPFTQWQAEQEQRHKTITTTAKPLGYRQTSYDHGAYRNNYSNEYISRYAGSSKKNAIHTISALFE
ncbi:TFIIB-type zinc ribbon-containing protein [Paenibacillus sp. SYP-B4298]|uniref:TFIIB-type zinc ribbon-containing protein n=1 Tax=Paenibacillus sp. SYP-B4298 TaxID=2996034 RepID=UPI0022DDE5C7|nr:zf-TFIIB domain-containing protein [Paenibacillus sp. SYP-B4298]